MAKTKPKTTMMKVDRERLRQHLEKISCGGQIPGAVFSGAFETRALSPDQLLCVFAPPLDKVEHLPEEVGIADLTKLLGALKVISGSGNEKKSVSIGVEKHRLVVNEEHRGVLELMTARPDTIGTLINDETAEKLEEKIPDELSIAITQSLIDGVKSTFALFKVEEVEVVIGKKGGMIRVGNENSDKATFPMPELKGDEEFSLLFGKHFVDVLSSVTNFADARILIGEPGSLIVVEDGAYKFFLSPRARPEDVQNEEEEDDEGGED